MSFASIPLCRVARISVAMRARPIDRFVNAFGIIHTTPCIRATINVRCHVFSAAHMSHITADNRFASTSSYKKDAYICIKLDDSKFFDLDLVRRTPVSGVASICAHESVSDKNKVSLSSNAFITHSTSRTESTNDSHSSAWKRLDIIIDREMNANSIRTRFRLVANRSLH